MYRVFCSAAAIALACPGWSSGETDRERALVARIESLEKRLAEVESRVGYVTATQPGVNVPPAAVPAPSRAAAPVDVNLILDGYYAWNFNRPYDRANQLRALDTSHHNLSLNQAVLMVERAPDPANGRRFGGRLDLMFGQATETFGGSPSNEPRPAVWRHVFQAYGTYVAPLGRGVVLDFGRWASSLGIEGNYTKDQINYSRSLFFVALPFYHCGLRASYDFNNRLGANYWLVNGSGQGDDFNNGKSHNFAIRLKPSPAVAWTVNYYTGNENLSPEQTGRMHIFDTYATWNPGTKLAIAGEFDSVVKRVDANGPPTRISGGAGYARYRFAPSFALGARGEYLSDRGGMFSGATQALKETTVTADWLLSDGFLVRWEWRRDWSNREFFRTGRAGTLKKEQNTATIGLVWWFGPREGTW